MIISMDSLNRCDLGRPTGLDGNMVPSCKIPAWIGIESSIRQLKVTQGGSNKRLQPNSKSWWDHAHGDFVSNLDGQQRSRSKSRSGSQSRGRLINQQNAPPPVSSSYEANGPSKIPSNIPSKHFKTPKTPLKHSKIPISPVALYCQIQNLGVKQRRTACKRDQPIMSR
jgi:hypothetical protein